MSSLIQVIFFSAIGGVVSLIGGMVLLSSSKRAKVLADYATPFAAGALIAAAFTDLLGEAAEQGDIDTALMATMVGILLFFFLERFLRVFHHHHDPHERDSDPTTGLIIVGDTVHNFIDGIAIAAGFLVDPSTGIIVTLAVAAHEIPQEIGDFGLLLHKGMSRRRVLLVNVMSAFATTAAAVLFYTFGQEIAVQMDIILGLIAGFFIYIAVSDIIPSIHRNEEKVIAGPQSLLLVLGVVVVSLVTSTLHNVIEDSGHSHTEEHIEQGDHEHQQGDEHSVPSESL